MNELVGQYLNGKFTKFEKLKFTVYRIYVNTRNYSAVKLIIISNTMN